ncbi:hypothetical protein D6817_05150 [Candidatus Pacearchaeota archaeon]|nr:MAG: hypothetical protein D6817_05150 [Candidatus Pacearchaeota archaeon]
MQLNAAKLSRFAALALVSLVALMLVFPAAEAAYLYNPLYLGYGVTYLGYTGTPYDGYALIADFRDGSFVTRYKYIDDFYGRRVFRVYLPSRDFYRKRSPYDLPFDLKIDARDPRFVRWVYDENDNAVKKAVIRAQARDFALWSAFARYDLARGKTAGEFSYYPEQAHSPVASDWRNKEEYDPLIHGIGNLRNYYYKPRFDPQLGYYNWRF